jgi:predicted membrane channel-forming protein YqfA (hemolysin III family)
MISLFILLIAILSVGTIFYTLEEKWSVIDSFYFSAMTITTAGFGDLHPTTDLSKLFTVFYIFMGLGVVLAFVQTLVQRSHHESVFSKIIRRQSDDNDSN